jgi:hypothetical protein
MKRDRPFSYRSTEVCHPTTPLNKKTSKEASLFPGSGAIFVGFACGKKKFRWSCGLWRRNRTGQGVVDPFLGANCAGVVITHALTSLDARPVSWPHVHIVLEFHRASESFKTRACVTTIK